MADVVADQSPEVIEGLVTAVSEAGIWENLLPVVRVMSEAHRLRLAATPPFHQESVLREIVTTAAESGLWIDLVPLLRVLPDAVFARVPGLVVELSNDALTARPELRDLLEQVPANILAAVETAADRLGLREELDAARLGQ